MGRGTQVAPAVGSPRLRWFAAHQTWSATGLFALLVLAYLWPVLLGGKVLSADALLYGFSPWHPYSPGDVSGFQNQLFGDIPLVVRPWHMLVRELLHNGTLPLWNPHVLTGVSLFQNPQSGFFTPLSLPLWILPFDYGIGVSAALKLGAAALGTYLLVRELRLQFLPGLIAGVSFALCSMNVIWLMPESVTAVTALFPWMLWLTERLLSRGGIGTGIALACVTAVALSGGHPGMQAHVLLASGAYAVLRVILSSPRRRGQRARRLGLVLGALVVGIGLVGAMLIPELLSGHDTTGTAVRKHGDLPGLRHMPFGMIRTPLFPDWWGRPSAFEGARSPDALIDLNYGERTFYAGVVALVLAAVGLTNRAALRRQLPFLIIGGLGLAVALHSPGLWWLFTHFPLLEIVENQRLHFVFELAVAVLAAFGLQAVMDRPQDRRRQLAVALATIAIGLTAAATAGASWTDAGHTLTHFLTGREPDSDGVLALTSIGWCLLFALGVTAALLALRRRPDRAAAVAVTLVLLASFDMLHYAHGYNPMGPADQAIVPTAAAIDYLRLHRDEGRVAATGLALPPDTASRYGLNDVRGYDPPYPTRRYFDLWRAATPEQAASQPLVLDSLTPEAVQVTGALGARFLLTDPEAPTPRRRDPALRSLRRVYRGIDAIIYRNPRATPRVFVARAVEITPDAASTRTTLVASAFDARHTVVIERNQPGVRAVPGFHGSLGTARIVAERNASVTLRATLDRRGVVVLADQLLDGWSVRVDGRAATPLRVDGVLRGVSVEAGRHEIEWSYRVPGLRAGVALSGAALALLIAAALVAWTRRRMVRSRR